MADAQDMDSIDPFGAKMPITDGSVFSLIDDLIHRWSGWDTQEDYYLTQLAPRIVRSIDLGFLNATERKIVKQLRARLSTDDWEQLPNIIVARRHDNENRRRRENGLSQLREQQKTARTQREREAAADRAQRREAREAEERKRRLELREQKRRAQEEQEREEQRLRERLIVRIRDLFEHDFLAADAYFSSKGPVSHLISRT